MELIFATNNQNKVKEIQAVLNASFNVQSLSEAGIHIDIPEPHDNLKDNALEKAGTIYKMTGKNCFSEDTGLEVDALNGAPGVHSARFAGPQADNEANIQKVLSALKNIEGATARFRTVICLIFEKETHFFEGICEGLITHQRRGTQGFGYDAVFVPEGATKTFAEMSTEEKNIYSHRKKAVHKMTEFLNQFNARKN